MTAREAMAPRSPQSINAETGSPDWFTALQERRHGRHGLWIPRHLEFSRHARERVLCLGNCLGTDWVHYAMHGAHVTVAAESEWLELIRKNFVWRGLAADTISVRGPSLHLLDESVDVVAANWLDDDEAPLKWSNEVARILKPGGKILALVRARWNIQEDNANSDAVKFQVCSDSSHCLSWSALLAMCWSSRHSSLSPQLFLCVRQPDSLWWIP